MPRINHIRARLSKAACKKGHFCVWSNSSDSGRDTRLSLAQILPQPMAAAQRPRMAQGGTDVTKRFICLTAIRHVQRKVV